MSTYGSVARGRRIEVDELDELSKRVGVAPVLARRAAAAGRGGRRVITGDSVNVNRIIGKADLEDVEKFGLNSVKSLGQAVKQPKALFGGLKSGFGMGRAGIKPSMSPAGAGARVGQRIGLAAGANPVKTGAALGAGGAGALMAGNGQRNRPQPSYAPPMGMYGGFGKRSYDPEAERRFRQGAYATGTGVAGLAAGGFGLHGIHRDTEALSTLRGMPQQDVLPEPIPRGENHSRGPNRGQPKAQAERDADAKWLETEKLKRAKRNQAGAAINSVRGKKGHLVRGRNAGLLAGGAALLGTSGALIRSRHEERWD